MQHHQMLFTFYALDLLTTTYVKSICITDIVKILLPLNLSFSLKNVVPNNPWRYFYISFVLLYFAIDHINTLCKMELWKFGSNGDPSCKTSLVFG